MQSLPLRFLDADVEQRKKRRQVICSGPSGAAVAAQTDAMPLNKKGDAKVEAKLSLPNGCVGPVIVLRERYEGKIGGWLAGTGM
jgi:hypothetical protein